LDKGKVITLLYDDFLNAPVHIVLLVEDGSLGQSSAYC
jgi:hypothetical protein